MKKYGELTKTRVILILGNTGKVSIIKCYWGYKYNRGKTKERIQGGVIVAKKLSEAILHDYVNRKCEICGAHLKFHAIDREDEIAWLACPYFLTGTDEDADYHTSYGVPLSVTGEKLKKRRKINLPYPLKTN